MQLRNSGSVLWLVSGGSAIGIAVEAAKKLAETDVSKLTVSLVDERYGEPGHKDSNWAQLISAGFSLAGAKLHPVLDGVSAKGTTRKYNLFLKQAFDECAYALALLGVGADGHTAGILPGSPAVNSDELVCYYEWSDYRRLTLTPKAMAKLDEAIVYARGEPKHQTLNNLKVDLPINVQPAQVIKRIRRASVYNDLVGEKI